jgi:hypothetical protein
MLFEPLLEHLRDVGEARSATEIEPLQAQLQCRRGDHGVRSTCPTAADRQGLDAGSTDKMSNLVVQELAFVDLGEEPDEF